MDINIYIYFNGGGSCSSIFADIYIFVYEDHIATIEDIKRFRYRDDILLVLCNDMKIIISITMQTA